MGNYGNGFVSSGGGGGASISGTDNYIIRKNGGNGSADISLDTDAAMAGNSDTAVASQKATATALGKKKMYLGLSPSGGADDANYIAKEIAKMPAEGELEVTLFGQMQINQFFSCSRSNTTIRGSHGCQFYAANAVGQGTGYLGTVASVPQSLLVVGNGGNLIFANDGGIARTGDDSPVALYTLMHVASTGTLPGGLSESVPVMITSYDTTNAHIHLATAIDAPEITLTNDGSGTHALAENIVRTGAGTVSTADGTLTTTAAHNLHVGDRVLPATVLGGSLPVGDSNGSAGIVFGSFLYVSEVPTSMTFKVTTDPLLPNIIPTTIGTGLITFTRLTENVTVTGIEFVTPSSSSAIGTLPAVRKCKFSKNYINVGIPSSALPPVHIRGFENETDDNTIINNGGGGINCSGAATSKNHLFQKDRIVAGSQYSPKATDIALHGTTSGVRINGAILQGGITNSAGTANPLGINFKADGTILTPFNVNGSASFSGNLSTSGSLTVLSAATIGGALTSTGALTLTGPNSSIEGVIADGSCTFDGTAPGAPFNGKFKWNQIGSLVTLFISLQCNSAGAANTKVTIPLSAMAGVPTPAHWSSQPNNIAITGGGGGLISNVSPQLTGSAGGTLLEKDGSGNWQIVIQSGSSSAIGAIGTVQYFVS